MKQLTTKIAACIFTLWYCFSIIGFDVHTCNSSGQSFVSTFINGLSCDDIHPGHHCPNCPDHECDCPGEAHHGDEISERCCSNNYIALSITGSRTDNNEHHHYDECHCGHCPCIEDGPVLPASVLSPSSVPHPDGADLLPRCPERSFLSVWRL